MRRLPFVFVLLLLLATGCWPTSVSLSDTRTPPEWKYFFVKTLENSAPNAPLSYPANLTESIKDGIQNRTKLLLTGSADQAQIQIEGAVTNYNVSPIALQEGDNAAQNRLTISARFTIYISEPEEDEMTLTSNRFMDYSSSQDLSSVEEALLEEINTQIVQDVINKLLSNW